MRRLSVLVVLSLTIACNKEVTEPPPPATATVIAATNNQFLPENTPIRVGGTVTWVFQAAHTVTFTPRTGAPDDIPQQASGTENRTFMVAGDYDYHCDLHATMLGTINVLVP